MHRYYHQQQLKKDQDMRNAKKIAEIPHMQDLNIGHSLISHAALVGLERAIVEMKQLIT